MEKFIIKIDCKSNPTYCHYEQEKLKQLGNLQRHYTSLTVFGLQGAWIQVAEFVMRCGLLLVDLHIRFTNFTTGDISELLKHAPALQNLNLCSSYSDRRQVKPNVVVTLKNLKKLTIDGSVKVLEVIKAPALKNLDIREVYNYASLDNFLKSVPRLETLAINMNAFENMTPGYPFKLKDIRFPGISFKLNDNIKKFLLSQAATVEYLHAVSTESEFYEIVLGNFQRLRTLHTDLMWLKANPEFYKILKPLALREIWSNGDFSSEIALQAVLGNCPGLVKFGSHWDKYLSKNLAFLAVHNINLEELTIPTIGPTNAKFQSLKALTLAKVENAEHLFAFLEANPTVRNVKLPLRLYEQFRHVQTQGINWQIFN